VTLAAIAAGFALSSPVLANGHPMPVRFTCSGANASPPLRWTAPPQGTTGFSLRLIDLDTHPHFRHWTLTGIPATLRSLATGTDVGHAARNTFGRTEYGGPCPPPGQKHRYLFVLDALGPGRKRLAEARLLVTYQR
jgi:Raf kinase inhibitor-like YbhB/YbcL family protein